jgi:hypothetical protein
MASGGDGYGEPPAGDHLQAVYRLWLAGHQLANGAAPWEDPYSFQPFAEPQTVLAGWPFALLYWPLGALFGPVVAWNLLLLGTIVAAGLLTYLWLRALDLGPGAAAIGGLAFAVAPYRLDQSASGHLLGWAALFLPLALLGIERARVASTPRRAHGWGALTAAALASIPLSGQLHLALGAVPLVLAYALVRRRRIPLLWTAAGALAAAAVGLVVRYTLIAGSAEDQGRSLDEVRKFQAEWADLFNRWHRAGSEEFVYFGWLTPVLAVAGVVVLWRGRRWLAVLLGFGAVVPILLALGTNLPTYSVLWHAFPPLRFPRVPERFMPIADLALAALLAFAVAELVRRAGRRGMAVSAGLLVLVALDLGTQPVSATAADPDNAAYGSSTCRSSTRGSTTAASTTITSCRSLASGRRATTPSRPEAPIRSRSPTTGSAAESGSRATRKRSRDSGSRASCCTGASTSRQGTVPPGSRGGGSRRLGGLPRPRAARSRSSSGAPRPRHRPSPSRFGHSRCFARAGGTGRPRSCRHRFGFTGTGRSCLWSRSTSPLT